MQSPHRARWQITSGHVLAAALVGAGLSLCAVALRSQRVRADGAALFLGERALTAAIAGHDLALPGDASRCANCHARGRHGRDATTPIDDPLATTAGPALDRARLLGALQRRNGPASSFDRSSFCRVLRTGVDPAAIMISRVMPRYQVSEKDCEALWRYLTFE